MSTASQRLSYRGPIVAILIGVVLGLLFGATVALRG